MVTTAVTALTAHHDFFYVQLSVEPKSGTLCFSAVGMLSPGTAAAGYYAGVELIPNRAKYHVELVCLRMVRHQQRFHRERRRRVHPGHGRAVGRHR